jgi:hypothetical protein
MSAASAPGGHVVKRGILLALVLEFLLFGRQYSWGQFTEQQERPHFTLAVCDQVGLSPEIVTSARRQTLEIFNRAEVKVTWIDLDRRSKCSIPPSVHKHFVVVILPRAPKDSASPEAMGLTPSPTGSFPRAYVFYNWVRMMVDIVQRNLGERGQGVILGHAIAHELGHLLMPSLPHSLRGIMSTEWHYSQWEDAVAGRLLFNDAEAKAIRTELQAR